MYRTTIAFFFALPVLANAQSVHLKYGVGLGEGSAKDSPSEVRHLSATVYTKPITSIITPSIEVGGWADRRKDLKRKNSFFAALGIGPQWVFGPLYGRAQAGLAGVSTTDINLGGRFPQFFQDFAIGFRGTNGVSMGVRFKHISSAGIHEPNRGRDMIGIDVGIPIRYSK